jgi:hypothetical protein
MPEDSEKTLDHKKSPRRDYSHSIVPGGFEVRSTKTAEMKGREERRDFRS